MQDGTPTTKTFDHVPSEIGAEEAEEVGVEHLLRCLEYFNFRSYRYRSVIIVKYIESFLYSFFLSLHWFDCNRYAIIVNLLF